MGKIWLLLSFAMLHICESQLCATIQRTPLYGLTLTQSNQQAILVIFVTGDYNMTWPLKSLDWLGGNLARKLKHLLMKGAHGGCLSAVMGTGIQRGGFLGAGDHQLNSNHSSVWQEGGSLRLPWQWISAGDKRQGSCTKFSSSVGLSSS